jgi:hypothetical protein
VRLVTWFGWDVAGECGCQDGSASQLLMHLPRQVWHVRLGGVASAGAQIGAPCQQAGRKAGAAPLQQLAGLQQDSC